MDSTFSIVNFVIIILLITIIMSIVTSFNNYEFIILKRGVVSRHAHYASVVSTLTKHPNSVGGKKGSVAARGTIASIVHTSTCAASVLQFQRCINGTSTAVVQRFDLCVRASNYLIYCSAIRLLATGLYAGQPSTLVMLGRLSMLRRLLCCAWRNSQPNRNDRSINEDQVQYHALSCIIHLLH